MGLQKLNQDDSNAYKLGYYQGISDLICELHAISQSGIYEKLNGFGLQSYDKQKIFDILCSVISDKASKLMQKNGKTDFLNYMQNKSETK